MSAFWQSSLALYLSKFLIFVAALWNCTGPIQEFARTIVPSCSASSGTRSAAAEVLGFLAALGVALDPVLPLDALVCKGRKLGKGISPISSGSKASMALVEKLTISLHTAWS